ncbi:hypothetical protein MBLNU230_g2585t1 [Neophaeotheca triangularis]
MPFGKRKRSDGGERPISGQSNASNVTVDSQATEAESEAEAAPWKALFFFTTRSHVPLLVGAITTSVIAGLVTPATTLFQGLIFERFSQFAGGAITHEEFVADQKLYIYYLLAISGGAWVIHALDFNLWLAFGELQAKSARDRLFHGLLEKDIEWYDMRKNGIGAQLPRLQAQIRDLQLACSQPLATLCSLVSTAVLSVIQAFLQSWDLTLVSLSTVPIVLLIVFWLNKPMQESIMQQDAFLMKAQKHSTNAFSAIETVKCFNGQDIEVQKYRTECSNAARWYYKVANVNSIQIGLLVLLSTSMFVQGFYYGSVLISRGTVGSAEVITTFLSAIGAFIALQAILPQMIVLEKGRNAGSTLRAIMSQVQDGTGKRRKSGLIRPAECFGQIEVKDLSFAYPSRAEEMALKDVSLSIPAGKMTFLIGKSGSGKSTLGQLLMRFYECTTGHIAVDGVPLGSLDVTWLRKNITLVEQTSLLFNDTVFRNIALGRTDHDNVTREEVKEVVEFALLQLMMVEMPKGLDTVVGYKGGSMSGGQRQRMALARARLRDTPILMLDESTSALDHISRALMMDAIRLWRRGKTTIIITHDISQILADDYVYVLEQGALVQEGYRKHMERMRDTPFQGFLPPDQRATDSAADERKGTQWSTWESVRTRRSSLSSEAMVPRSIGAVLDPLEAHLKAGENKRRSFLPVVFQQNSNLAGMRLFGPNGRPVSGMPSPLKRQTTSSSKITTPSTPLVEESGQKSVTRASTFASPTDWSKMLENFVDKTGKLAAESRSKAVNIRRRPVAKGDDDIELVAKDEDVGDEIKEEPADGEKDPELAIVKKRSFKEIFATYWPNLGWQERMLFCVAVYCATVHAAASPVFSFILSQLVNTYAEPETSSQRAVPFALAILAISLVDCVHTYVYRFSCEYTGQRWVDNIRVKAMAGVLDQPREFFDKEENSTSRMTESLDRNAEETRNLVGRFASLVYVAALMGTISLAWATAAQWRLTLIALCAAPYVFGVTKAFAAISTKWEGHSNDASDAASAIFTETFTNIKTVRALTLEPHFLEKYTKATNETLRVGFKRAFYIGLFFGMADSAGNFATALIYWIGTWLADEPSKVPAIIQVFSMLAFTITNVSGVLEYIPQIGASQDTASRLLRLAYLPKDSHEHRGDTRIVTVGDIVFNDVRFSYPSRPDQTVLNHVNIHIQPGTCTAIVGGSGSGKSTIANLLLNLYGLNAPEPHTTANPATASSPSDTPPPLPTHSGEITISARDLQHIHTPSLRSLITIVSQTSQLFPTTAAENITYGLPAHSPLASPSAIETAARQAGIHDFLTSLPLGYATRIGEGGLGLSGGQVQRVAIARALCRRPAVLVLDEATSALDVESAGLVRRTVQELVRRRRERGETALTVVIITHARDMMAVAENVVVLDRGSVVEEGGFEELLARKGVLANLLSAGEWGEEGEGREGRVAEVRGVRDAGWRGRKGRKPRRLVL